MSATYDVTVIGAGLAGLECARLLGEAGLRTLLVERKSSLTQSVSTTGIFVRKTLEDFDLPQTHLGPPIVDVALYSPARRVLRLTSAREEFRIGRMAPLYQHYLDRCRRAGVCFLEGARFTGLLTGPRDSVVKLEEGGCAFAVATRFLVGADGARSRVARHLGLGVNRAFIAGYEEVWRGVRLDSPPALHCFLDPHFAPGYLAWVAHDGEETHIGTGGYLHRFHPTQALDRFRKSHGAWLKLDEATLTGCRGGLIPVGGVLRRIANPHGLLIGDAAGAPSPLTAGGLDACLRLSCHAARVITAYLASGDSGALQAYSGSRFRTRFFSRLWMRRVFAATQNKYALEAGLALMSMAAFRGIARHIFFGRGSFPDIEPLPARTPALHVSR